ncbi:hypothetical protein OG333_37450 (plasmid) [Streptomyces anulatus]|uniref:hypothetical protein n=1 Tax=Streptomyces anulatus TaxID=1892 RepID=UPI002F91053B|nr:hypothetical protein OG333_37450 [Streptomyces anulatus]
MALLERQPDNSAIDAELRKHGIEPSSISGLPVRNPLEIPAEMWALTDVGAGAWGVVGRHRVMRYVYGEPRPISAAVSNPTSSPVTKKLIASETVGTWASFPFSSRVEAELFNVVSASVTAAFAETWTSEKAFTESLEVTIAPGHAVWLEARPVPRVLEGDFVAFFRVAKQLEVGRFSRTVTAPGAEGNLRDVIIARQAPVTPEVTEALLSCAVAMARFGSPRVRQNDDGTISLRGCIMTALADPRRAKT